MDQGETSVRGALVLFFGICAAIFVAWIVLGPGDQWAIAVIAQLRSAVDLVATWYQQVVEGPSKLIAPAITIASGSYAIYKGYVYAESRLHYRLGDYLAREEQRLADARRQLRLIIERPSVDRRFREPVFLVDPLKRAVRELGWGSYFFGPQLGYVSFQLDTSITELNHRVKLAEVNQRHLKRQLATAHLLKGAMHVAGASNDALKNGSGRPHITSALGHFESALAVDGHDCEALEYAAHAHIFLKQDGQAKKRLETVLELTSGEAKSLTRARAFRYMADIEAGQQRPRVARGNLRAALKVLPNLHFEDRIEEAEIHEALGDRQITVHAHIQARSHWEIAKALYCEIKTPAAKEGAERVAAELAKLDTLPDNDSDDDE
jgi:hypothetical protein